MTMQRISTQHNGGDQVEKLAMANCLTLLSRINKTGRSLTGRVFKCKTCNRQFPTFQALGGHRANHKKSKLIMAQLLKKPKTHECSICGVEFEKGQALGGHMRRHGGLAMKHGSVMKEDDLKSSSSSSNSVITNPPPVSSSRIFCEDLDLDLKLGW